jgi:hypothetical protein
MVDLNVFCNLVDLYIYMPHKIDIERVRNVSPDIHTVMSSTKEDRASSKKANEMDSGDLALKRDL